MLGYSVRHALSSGIEATSKYYRYLGYVSMCAMSLIVTVDVSGRYLFNKPLRGATELVEELMVCCIFFILPHVTGVDRHIKVDVFVSGIARMAPRSQRITSVAFDIIMLVILALLAWRGFIGTVVALHSGEITEQLQIPHYPFWIVMAVGFSLAFFTLLVRFTRDLKAKLRGGI